METISPVTQDDSSGANPSSVKSDDSSPRHESGRGSPPPKCAICLGICRNKSFTDSCLHQFCFKCLLTWSKVKAECPLCKQNFKSIIHNVRSNHQYEEYMVEQREVEEPIERFDIDNPQATRRFRYRTTLTLPRRDSLAIQQLLLQYPMTGLLPMAGRGPPARRRRSPASFRRTVYRHRLWARPLPDFTGRFRDCSPEFYRYNDTQMHRLVPWLNRELHYLLNENIGHISYVITRILELLPQYPINSPEFREAMQPYFRDRTEHFLHELYCFASTPYDLTGYDRNVQYTTDTRISTMVNEVISSSESDASVDSDIVMVSSSEPVEAPPGPSRVAGPSRVPQPVYPQNYISQPASNNVIPIETISQSDTDDDSSEVMVVGYIKPPQDRTPEVVDLLGSDSDVIVQDTVTPEPVQNVEPQESVPLVKLTLKRHRIQEQGESDSEGSTSRVGAARRRRRRSNGTATTSDTCRSTPSPCSDWQPTASEHSNHSSKWTSSLTSSRSSTSDTTMTTTSSDDPISDTSSVYSPSNSNKRSKLSRKKSKRKVRKDSVGTVKEKKKSKRRTSRSCKEKSTQSEKGKRSKRKSSSGKGISSKKNESSSSAPIEQTQLSLDQPSTSGISNSRKRKSSKDKKKRTSRESKRLKSVVNVMYNRRYEDESSSSSTSNVVNSSVNNQSSTNSSVPIENDLPELEPSSVAVETRDYRDSDWDDDLPLNLTMQKTFYSL